MSSLVGSRVERVTAAFDGEWGSRGSSSRSTGDGREWRIREHEREAMWCGVELRIRMMRSEKGPQRGESRMQVDGFRSGRGVALEDLRSGRVWGTDDDWDSDGRGEVEGGVRTDSRLGFSLEEKRSGNDWLAGQ